MTTGYKLINLTKSVSIAAMLLGVASAAHADKATPAPISYSDNTVTRSQAAYARAEQPRSAPERATHQSVTSASAPAVTLTAPLEADAKTRRLEFRYPDQPGTYYSANGARAASNADNPIAFSSAKAAIAPEQASALTLASDPAILAGGFDARAAAAKIAREQAAQAAKAVPNGGQPIRIASLTPQAADVAAKPLTISRAQARPDTTLSEESGKASIYSESYDGHPTANGEIYDQFALTAAHRTLPLPSLVHVTNLATQKEIVVRVNDRGPFDGDHILELSPRAGEMLGIGETSNAEISLRYLGPAPVKTVESLANKSVEADSLPALDYVAGPPKPLQAKVQPQKIGYTPNTQSGIFIQAGSFSDISNAQRLSASLKPFHAVKIEEARVNGSDYFRVIVGPFNDRAEADYQRQQMAFDGLADGFVTTR